MDLKQYKRVLSCFAHPDDETLAAGATIAKLSRLGAEVHVAIPATGIHSRRNKLTEHERTSALEALQSDCAQAMAKLGVSMDHLYFGEFSDNELDHHPRLELIHWIETLLERIQPDLVLTHHRYCTNIDHQYCHEAVVIATRPSSASHIPVLSAEVPSSTGYLKPVQWEPNCYIEVSEKEVEAKIQAMQSYRGEARPDPHPRSPEVLKALAKVRGSESGFYYAEAFMIQKIFASE